MKDEKEKNRKNNTPQTTQDERAPQDENPMATPVKSGRNSEKTLNETVEKKKERGNKKL